MDSAHALAVVCRAKQVCRENGVVAQDEILGYLCQCANISGVWADLLGDHHGVGPRTETEPALAATSVELQQASQRRQDEARAISDAEHVHLVKAIEKLARSIANQFAEGEIPVQLARIQLDMEKVVNSEYQSVENEQRDRADRVSMKAKALLGARRKHITIQEMKSTYDQVVFYVCMQARLDSALHNPVQEEEVRAAVESVFPFSALAQFLTLSSAEKELQLQELPYIVAGVCLFNKAMGASEARACVAALQENSTNPSDTLHRCLEQLQCVRNRLLYYSGSIGKGEVGAVHDENMLWLQAQAFLINLHTAAWTSTIALGKFASEIESSVAEVQSMVQEMTAVPKETVLPVFHRIGQLYEATLDERRQATLQKALLDQIVEIIGRLPVSILPTLGSLTSDKMELAALAESGSPEWLDACQDRICVDVSIGGAREQGADAGTAFDNASGHGLGPEHLAWGGIDVVVFVRHKGLLVTATIDAMRVQHPADTGPWYGFSSDAAAQEFKQRSQEYLNAASAVLLGKPHIIPLVGQVDATVPPLLSQVMSMGYHILRLDYSTQTPTHFVEQHVDGRYQWNEWALRRQALAMAKLQTKLTKSAQTAVSTFRRDNESQYWNPKTATSQTPYNKGQSMPKKLRYMAGMRGDPISAKFSVVSLELDLGQPHQL